MNTMNKLLRSQIDDIARDCKEPKWDSYNAKSISEKTIELARLLAQNLDDSWDAVPCETGEIIFENVHDKIDITITLTSYGG